jgi:2-oxoglutarate dehydrogenase E1 component
MSESLKEQYASTPLFGSNAPAVEAMYEQFLVNPDSVSRSWRNYFQTLAEAGDGSVRDIAHSPIRQQLKDQASEAHRAGPVSVGLYGDPLAASQKQAAVSRLIQVYSLRGHQIADLDPLGLVTRHVPGVLKLDYLGLDESDMDAEFSTMGLADTGSQRMTLRDILALLRQVYTGKVGAEFAHVSRARERLWLRKRFEKGRASPALPDEERIWLLQQLTAAEGIERYLHTRFVGQKRFSL